MVKSNQLDEVIKSMKLLETKNENLTKTVSKRIPLQCLHNSGLSEAKRKS